MSTTSWIWSALLPHPPIIVPEVGRGGELGAKPTVDGVLEIMNRVSSDIPDRLLLMSPHQPYADGALFINSAKTASGSFAAFNAPNVSIDTTTPTEDTDSLAKFMKSSGIPVTVGSACDLSRDQGSMVPLYFMQKQIDRLPPTVLMNVSGLGSELAFKVGELLASFNDGRRWALIASGDLSHRLVQGAPAGYSPSGAVFDKTVVDAVRHCDMDAIRSLSAKTIFEAGECGLCPLSAMIGLCSASGDRIDLLSYEGPFGVGYCCAISMKR